jgi:hypothetical protein
MYKLKSGWNQDIVEKERVPGYIKRQFKQGKINQDIVNEAREVLKRLINYNKLETWNNVVQKAEGEQVWKALKDTKSHEGLTVRPLKELMEPWPLSRKTGQNKSKKLCCWNS